MVDDLSKCLLGQPAVYALGMVSNIGGITDVTQKTTQQFPTLFEGLGKGEYTIQLQDNAQPHALTTPRRVPIPLMPAVKEELSRMEKLGVITKVSEPTARLVCGNGGGTEKERKDSHMRRFDKSQQVCETGATSYASSGTNSGKNSWSKGLLKVGC